MPAPDISLSSGEILVTQGVSGLGVISVDGKVSFGVVAKVNDLSDNVIVGSYVMYESAKGIKLIFGSTMYVLLNEDHVSGVEVIPP